MTYADYLIDSSPDFNWPFPGVLHEIRIKAVCTANDDGQEAAKIKLFEISAQIDMANKAVAEAGIRFLFDPNENMIPGSADGEVLKDTTLNSDGTNTSR